MTIGTHLRYYHYHHIGIIEFYASHSTTVRRTLGSGSVGNRSSRFLLANEKTLKLSRMGIAFENLFLYIDDGNAVYDSNTPVYARYEST